MSGEVEASSKEPYKKPYKAGKWRQLGNCLNVLRELDMVFSREISFDGLEDEGKLRFDIMVLVPKGYPSISLIEVDGAQHFRKGGFGGGDREFNKQKYHDYMKVLFCRERKIPILRISHKEEGSEYAIISRFIEGIKRSSYIEIYSNPELYSDQKSITREKLGYVKKTIEETSPLIISCEPSKGSRSIVKVVSSKVIGASLYPQGTPIKKDPCRNPVKSPGDASGVS